MVLTKDQQVLQQGARRFARERLLPDYQKREQEDVLERELVAEMGRLGLLGMDLVLPGRNYEPAMLYELLDGERVTITCGVPTMWLSLTDWMEREGRTLPQLRTVYSAGSAAPRNLIDKFAAWGVEVNQLWGMTEALGITSPSLSPGSLGLPAEEQLAQRYKLPTAERPAARE